MHTTDDATGLISTQLAPIELVVLQGTSFCNLDCQYCDLSPESRRVRTTMDLPLIERLFTELFQSGRLAPTVTVVWHSGEPLTLSPAYYDDAITLIDTLKHRYGTDDVSVRYAIQTNAVLIDEKWCSFFERHAHELELGVSCDGPADLHDAFRVGWSGRPSHERTLRGMDRLEEHGIKYKVIAVVTRRTLERPEAFYEFFRARRAHLSGFHFNLIAESTGVDPDLTYSAEDREAYFAFYRRLLELQRADEKRGDRLEILNFTLAAEGLLAAGEARRGFFDEAVAPLKSLTVDASGNLTTFYAGLSIDTLPDVYGDGRGLALGNILETPLEDMLRSQKLERMVSDFLASRRACESSCEYFGVCPGGYELLKKKSLGSFEATETVECLIHVKTLVDALVDDIDERAQGTSLPA